MTEISRARVRNKLVVWQYNCNKEQAVMLDLQHQLDSRVVDILLLQEPYMYKGEIRGLSTQYRVLRETHMTIGVLEQVL